MLGCQGILTPCRCCWCACCHVPCSLGKCMHLHPAALHVHVHVCMFNVLPPMRVWRAPSHACVMRILPCRYATFECASCHAEVHVMNEGGKVEDPPKCAACNKSWCMQLQHNKVRG